VIGSPFESLSLPAPVLSPAQAAAITSEHFGVTGELTELGSNQEANVLVQAPAGAVVLKVANPAFAAAELELQNAAMLHAAATRPPFALPHPLPALDGRTVVPVLLDGVPTHARLLTFVPGDLLVDRPVLAEPVLESFGRLVAQVGAALAGFEHPAAERVLQWDLRRVGEVVDALASHVGEAGRRHQVLALSEAAAERLAVVRDGLRQQVVHADLADYNVLTRRGADGRPEMSGVIDFGDVMRTWLVGDLATAVTAGLWRPERSALLDVVAVARGYHETVPLTEPEVQALWPLVVARAAVLAVSVEHQVAHDPANRVAAAERDRVWDLVDRVAEVPPTLAEEALRLALGLAPGLAARRGSAWAARPIAIPLVDLPAPVVLDLAVTSPALVDGEWEDPGLVHRLAGGQPAVMRHGEPRLLDIAVDSVGEPDAVSLGTQVVLPPGTSVRTPGDLVLAAALEHGVRLADGEVDVLVRGVDPRDDLTEGDLLRSGEVLGQVGPPGILHVQVVAEPGLDSPARTTGSLAAAWLALCPDPSRLLGPTRVSAVHDPALQPAEHLLRRRDAVVAAVQEHYFRTPPRIERGWRHHLYDVGGRAYVDMVNNVAVLGHSHPGVADAAARQYRLLNTNSRFLYEAMVRLAERVVALLPEPLDSVFFVNSGSEAVDLALRLVRTATGRRDVVALRGGYHGWTTATDEVSTSLQDNPHAPGTRPPWVHLAAMPNTYRGEHRGPDAADRYADDVRARLAEMAEQGRGPAAFLAEPLSGNAGGVELPPGYLAQVYAAVRSAGGLCIADEVQVGYGRLGTGFWGFAEHGVVPDVVTMAKAAGNGHPLGFVVTRREVAEAFGSQGSFFSSVGGSPVSSVVGLAVLDALERDGLQHNAALVGAHLSDRLRTLADRHPMIGTIHGHGLYQGVELVRDPETREPATHEAVAVCERLLDLGVLSQPAGDHSNVLKVKPPLCLTRRSADLFVDALDDTLSRGW
jgi:4-aminobutyrate aminotransferase-like enzyme/Ser/Thr protein kinase RdoA (MazF antagonist)